MRLKSAYKYAEKIPAADTPVPNIPSEPPPPASEKVSVEISDRAGPETTVAIEAPPADEATVALMRQLDSLRKSEELQKQYALHQRAVQASQRGQPQTRVQFLQSQGLTKAEAEFFDSREDMMANQQQASEAAAEALAAGIERGSPEFFQAVEEGFDQRLTALNQRAAEQPAPAFSAPPRAAPSPAASADKSAMYAAPVSRGTASYETGQRPVRQIKLTPQDQEYARIAGITDVEYAKQKQKLNQHKANGDYTGRE